MSETVIELDLIRSLRKSVEKQPAKLWLIERLLNLLAEATEEGDASKNAQFLQQLQEIRDLLKGTSGEKKFKEAAVQVVRICEEHVRQTRAFVAERENSYAELISLMRGALRDVAKQSDDFRTQLIDSSERINRLTKIEEIGQLKSQIVEEVSVLKRAIEEKQKLDEKSQAQLTKELDTLRGRLETVTEEATMDPVTEIPNRRSFDTAVNMWIAAYQDSGEPFVLAMLDIDNFKFINDRHGHQVGDRVLLAAAQWIRHSIRERDYLARYGGEEFVILLERLGMDQAGDRLSNLLGRVAGRNFEYKDGPRVGRVRFTMSCGITEFVRGDTPETLIKRADDALLEAKKQGKNQVQARRKSLLGTFWKSGK